jgi:hypothetical protein
MKLARNAWPITTTTTKGRIVNPKLTRIIVKVSLGIAVSAMIGTLIKSEREIVDKLDELWAAKALENIES